MKKTGSFTEREFAMHKPAPKKTRPGLLTGSIVTLSLIFLVIAALLTINNGVLATMTSFMSEAVTDSQTETSQPLEVSSSISEQSEIEEQPLPQDIIFAKPNQMKGVYLTAGKDYLLKESDSGETVKAQIDAAFSKLAEWGFNTVLVPVSTGDRLLYISSTGLDSLIIKNSDGTEFDAPAYIYKCAKERGFFTYGILDMMVNKVGSNDPSTNEGARTIQYMVREAVTRYSFDGWLLDNPGYAAGKCGSFDNYMMAMPGGGFDNFMRDNITAAVIDVVKAIKNNNINQYVGLLADAVWAHKSSNELGSNTNGIYESLTDGFADTRAWIEQGLFDFVMVKNGQSTAHAAASFNSIFNWWAELCTDAGVTMYIQHNSNKVCGSEQGWKSPDQLAQQVLACKKSNAWSGSVFTSFNALVRDNTGSTSALIRAFGDTLNEQYISRTLKFTAPTKYNITTYESKINIRGSADPNFPLTMNGKNVELSAHGFFSIDLSLSIGKNTFTFKHKGDTVTYNITYRIVVIQSIEPSSELTLEGGTSISITAVAYKNANIYAKVGGTTVQMKQAAIQSDEGGGGDEESDYVNYSGTYKLPAGIEGKTQSLGKVTVYGSYKTLSESKTGGSITVKAKPVIPPIEMPDENGVAPPVTGKLVTINRDYAETFLGTTTDDWSRPNNAYLPKGTIDVIVKEVYDSASRNYYYLLGCGRRVYKSNASIYKDVGTLNANSISLGEFKVDTACTTISLDSGWKVPYNLKLLPQKYGNESTQNYNITSFTATYVDITFSYTTSVSGLPDVSNSPLFKSAEWFKGKHTHTLRLHLRHTGAFYGYSVGWKEDTIQFKFHHNTAMGPSNKPLLGKRIVVDPGHGGNSIGTAGGNTSEKAEVLKYGLQLRDKLTALGATVIMTRTKDVNPDMAINPPSLDARTAHAREGKADLFISIHMDGSLNGSAHGYTVFYFNEYSQPYAKAVATRAETTYKSFTNKSGRGIKWAPFHVTRLHDCPSLLIECGFMSNTMDLELLISPSYREAFTQAMADGIVDYFKARKYVAIEDPSKTTNGSSATESTSLATTATIAPAGLIALSRKRKRKIIRKKAI